MYPHLLKAGLLAVLAGLLIACSGGADKNNDGFTISGMVGDGSLVGAAVTVTDANGAIIVETLSDEVTRYVAAIPPDTPTPLRITAKDGVDLVTGGASEFALAAVAFSTAQTVNVSPLSALATQMAECSGATSESGLNRSWSLIAAELGMGLSTSVNPMSSPIATNNAAQLVLANEAFREVVRRTVSALANGGSAISSDEALTQIACDLEEDAQLNGVGRGADPRTAVTFQAARAAVLLELIAGELYVGGQDVAGLLDQVIETVLGSSGVSVDDVIVTDALIDHALAALSVFLVQLPDDEIFALALLLGSTDANTAAAEVAAALDAAHQTVVWGMPERVALADATEITALAARMDQQGATNPPAVSFAASETTVDNGESVTLSWASAAADRCFADVGWSGEVALDGSFVTSGHTRTTDYVLECTGLGGTSAVAVQVVVANPDPAPTTTLTVQNQSVDAGNATTLNWSSVNADQCQASGSWTGPKGTSGSQSTGTLNSSQTYSLACSGSGGSDTATVTVTVNGTPPPPEPVPTVVLNAADSVVDAGESTTLTWSSADASSCQASNGWSGSKAVAGSQVVGPLNANTTYTLTCSGAGGNAVVMITVTINATLSLDWVAPTENVDGSLLTDLSGYKIHYGNSSRNYFGSADVNDANATSFAITLPSGSYYVAMTALDADDNESAYSNEVLKATN